MLDMMRSLDMASRPERELLRRCAAARHALLEQFGRPGSPDEVAALAGVDLASVEGVHERSKRELETIVDTHEALEAPVDELLARWQIATRIRREIALLPARTRHILRRYYDDDWSFRAIGEELGLTESRVCQIHGEALAMLRTRFEDMKAA